MTWDWGQITALSSLAGVIGGLISVIFLIFEVRHNAHAIEGATVQALMSLEGSVFATIATNAELYLAGCASSAELAPADALRFDRIVGAQMSLYYSAYVQFRERLIDDEVWEAYRNALIGALAEPGFARHWQAMAHRYPRSFRAAIAPAVAAQIC